MAKINSRSKGKRGELELAHWFKERGIEARRGQQFKGSPDSPDLITELDDMIHIECKRVESLSLYKAFLQAEEDSGEDQFPVVMHRRNARKGEGRRLPWLAIMDARDWLVILLKARAYDALKRGSGSLCDDHQLGRPQDSPPQQDHPHQTTLLGDLGLE